MSTSSVCGRIVSRMAAAVTAVAEVEGRVFDSRTAALEVNEFPCIVIQPPDTEQTSVFGAGVDHNVVEITVDVMVQDDAWRSVADRIAVAAHAALMADTQLQALVFKIAKAGRRWEAADADGTAAADSITFRLVYLSLASDLASSF